MANLFAEMPFFGICDECVRLLWHERVSLHDHGLIEWVSRNPYSLKSLALASLGTRYCSDVFGGVTRVWLEEGATWYIYGVYL